MENNQSLYQHGTLAALVPGLFAGTLTVNELLKHGDTGIGTMDGLNGELIILNGVVYQATASGEVVKVDGDAKVPFANVHFVHLEESTPIANLTYLELKDVATKRLKSQNLFSYLSVHGTFSSMKTRVVHGQQPPYPTLTETASQQEIFDAANVTGTLTGYYSPALYAGVTSPGFHLHFLSDTHEMGGHVLDCQLTDGELAIQPLNQLQFHLPDENSEFLKADLDDEAVLSDIKKAEN